MHYELEGVKVTRLSNAAAAGSTDITSGAILDMAGFDGVIFIALFGALTANQVTSIRAQHGDASDLADAADIAGSAVGPMADDDDNKMLVLEIYKPQKRYLKCVVDRATANAVLDGIIAVQYRARSLPTSQPTSVMASKSLNFPASGTA